MAARNFGHQPGEQRPQQCSQLFYQAGGFGDAQKTQPQRQGAEQQHHDFDRDARHVEKAGDDVAKDIDVAQRKPAIQARRGGGQKKTQPELIEHDGTQGLRGNRLPRRRSLSQTWRAGDANAVPILLTCPGTCISQKADMDFNAWRRRRISDPAYRWAREAMPGLSDTERDAIEAGDVWWDADLFTGDPNWNTLLAVPQATLTATEQQFIDGPVAQLCAMLNEWDITWSYGDLPEPVWRFMREHRFFGMIIPESYGGLGFSPYAHSEVVRRISAYSVTAGVTVMVPNSLGPGELLLQCGTRAQRDYWLPRLADGTEVPCFGLTSPEAGSDAASMTDTGVVCRQVVDGREILGIRLNWHKRYITLGPIATVLGLAFKLQDPDGLLGGPADVGISVALVPTDAPGVSIGRRHLPSMQVFQNGPNQGQDVFVPLEALIGGPAKAGQGWQMLMSALAAGRGISLPSLSAAAAVYSAHTTGMYARVRQQFGIPVGRFEGVQEKLGRLAANAYLVEAARRLTCAALNQGHKPAVVSAIMKYHATERMRESVNDAMDIHGGKAVIDGPANYLSPLYRALPIAITVEGANILTR